MDQLLGQLTAGGTVTILETLVALVLSFALCLVLAYFYRQSHRGLSYSVSLVHAMILLGVTVSVIMLVIGSNIARAFTLVGALSIIRFRNPIKDSRDVAFLFVALAIGMAVGTGFYATAVLFTLFMCFVAYALTRFGIGVHARQEALLKVQAPSSFDHGGALAETFYRSLREHALLSVESLPGGAQVEAVYSVELKPGVAAQTFLADVRQAVGDGRVVLITGQDAVDV